MSSFAENYCREYYKKSEDFIYSHSRDVLDGRSENELIWHYIRHAIPEISEELYRQLREIDIPRLRRGIQYHSEKLRPKTRKMDFKKSP